jgi:hypothetical protein
MQHKKQIRQIVATAIEYMTSEIDKLVSSVSNTTRTRKSKSSSRPSNDTRRMRIYSAIEAGRSKAWIKNQFKLAEYQYRGYKAAHTRGQSVTA